MSNLSKPSASLVSLPDDWKEPVAFFYAFFSDILKGTIGISAQLRVWHEQGLTLEQAKQAMRRIMTPDRCRHIEHAGKLMASLANEIDLILNPKQGIETPRRFAERKAREAK